jgi:hypothetical protein
VKELRCAGLRAGKSLEGSKLFGLSRQVGLVDRACGQGGECNPDAVVGKPGKRGLDWVGAA